MENDESTLKKEDANFYQESLWEIRTIRNFCEWVSLWQKSETKEQKLGLLHVGFIVSLQRFSIFEKKYDEIDRLIPYFAIANGWDDDCLLELLEDGSKKYFVGYDKLGSRITKMPKELRQEVARKAFNMLCLNYFSKVELMVSGRRGDEFARDWEEAITSERLFPVIQNFFMVQKGILNKIEIRNLSSGKERRSHNEQQAVEFLLNLARFIWGRKKLSEPYYPNKDEEKKYRKYLSELCVRIDLAKPWMIEILNYIDRLDVLQKWMLDLDETCLKKLKEIALRNELSEYDHSHFVKKSRPVANLDEACYVGSRAAWFLKEHELKKREHARLKGIREAEEKIAEANSRIKELAG